MVNGNLLSCIFFFVFLEGIPSARLLYCKGDNPQGYKVAILKGIQVIAL